MRLPLLALCLLLPVASHAQWGGYDSPEDAREDYELNQIQNSAYQNQMLWQQEQQVAQMRKLNKTLKKMEQNQRREAGDPYAGLTGIESNSSFLSDYDPDLDYDFEE